MEEKIVSFKYCESLDTFNNWLNSSDADNGAIVFINDSTGKFIWAQGTLFADSYTKEEVNVLLDGLKIKVVEDKLPSFPNSNTIYFVK